MKKKDLIKEIEQLRKIIFNIPACVYWKDKQGNYLGCNKVFLDMNNINSEQEVIGKKDSDLSWSSEASLLRQNDIKVMSLGNYCHFEETVTLTNNEKCTYLAVKVPLRDNNENIIGIIGTSIDTTKQKKLEEELIITKTRAEAYLQNAVEHIPGNIYWKNLKGVYLGCNPSFAKTAGFSSPNELINKVDDDMPWRDKAKDILKLEQEVIRSGKSQEIEELNILPNTEEQYYLTKKSPLYNKEGTIIGIISSSFNITEHKQHETEKLNMMMSLAVSIAHEIRTPLATVNICAESINDYNSILIDAYQQALLQGITLTYISDRELEKLKNIPYVIQRETLAANTFVDIMLMNIKPRLGEHQTFSISQCVDDALTRYPFQKKERERVIWRDQNDFVVKGSQLLMVHVLFNLFKNALYYTHQRGDIHIWLEPNCNGHHQLYFKDTGEGIPQDVLPHIFDQFYSKTYHGTGIGLTYCKIVMESLGGEITCDSVEGSHTQFILNFPIIK